MYIPWLFQPSWILALALKPIFSFLHTLSEYVLM